MSYGYFKVMYPDMVLVICFHVLLTDFEFLRHLLLHLIKVSRLGLFEGCILLRRSIGKGGKICRAFMGGI